MNLELQQRAVEYNAIFKKHEELRGGLFEAMPEFEANKTNLDNSQANNDEDNATKSDFIVRNYEAAGQEAAPIINVSI